MMDATRENDEMQNGSVSNDSEDGFEYKKVSLEDDWTLLEGEENLEATVEAVRDRAEARPRSVSGTGSEAVDDFLRNFLYHAGMTETLDCFQTEWTEMTEKKLVGVVPSVYTENQRLDRELESAKREREEYQAAASAAAQALRRVQKARDLHRMQCTRMLQEKNRLIEEMRKLKAQCDSYEPAVKRMDAKHRALLKQTTLVSLERDEAVAQAGGQSAEHSALFWKEPRSPTSAGRPRSWTAGQ